MFRYPKRQTIIYDSNRHTGIDRRCLISKARFVYVWDYRMEISIIVALNGNISVAAFNSNPI